MRETINLFRNFFMYNKVLRIVLSDSDVTTLKPFTENPPLPQHKHIIMSARYTKRSRKRRRPSSSESEDTNEDNHYHQNYRTPVVKRRKINYSEYERTFTKMLKSTSVLLQNKQQQKFIEVVINASSKSFSFIRGKFDDKATKQNKQTKSFKYKKSAKAVPLNSLLLSISNVYSHYIC